MNQIRPYDLYNPLTAIISGVRDFTINISDLAFVWFQRQFRRSTDI